MLYWILAISVVSLIIAVLNWAALVELTHYLDLSGWGKEEGDDKSDL